jgi:LAS superfamily LD-carboxypeptidase LdcB
LGHFPYAEAPASSLQAIVSDGSIKLRQPAAAQFLAMVKAATDLQVSFETTAAFRWLQQNAARFGFEMSFPRSSPQTVSYEPWHWRFVGDRHSLETFYRARTAHPKP